MLRRLILRLTLGGCALAAGCGNSASGSGVTSDFAKAARDARSYMTSDLIPLIGTSSFPSALVESRTKVRMAQSKVSSEADQGVWLLLTMVNVKSDELNGTREMIKTMHLSSQTKGIMRESALEVASERDTCLSEADSWLSGSSLLVASLKTRPCLQQARLAMAVLSNKK